MDILKVILDLLSPEAKQMGDYIVSEALAPIVIPAAMMAVSALTTAFGQDKAAKAKQANDKLLEERRGMADAWYQKSQLPYFDTEAGKSFQSLMFNNYSKVLDKNKNNAIAGGITPEADVAFRGKVLENYGNTLLGANASDANRKLYGQTQYQNQISDLLNMETANNNMDAQRWTELMNGISGALSSVGQAYGEGAFS